MRSGPHACLGDSLGCAPGPYSAAPPPNTHTHMCSYAFGITMWELYTGCKPFLGIPHAFLGHKVGVFVAGMGPAGEA